MQARCTCGLLDKWAKGGMTPISYKASVDTYVLRVSTTRSVEVEHCPFCGGHEKIVEEGRPVAFFRGGDPCTCGLLQTAAAEEGSEIFFNEKMNEHKCRGFIFYYCPACGGKMPESRRGSLFTEMSPDESREFFSLVKGLKSLAQITQVLGPPDRTDTPGPMPKELLAPYGMKNIVRQISYSIRWRSIQGMIQEMEDGTIQVSCSGKPKAEDAE